MNKSQAPEKCTIDFQLVLNRAWIYCDSAEDPVGEKNFVITTRHIDSVSKRGIFPLFFFISAGKCLYYVVLSDTLTVCRIFLRNVIQ